MLDPGPTASLDPVRAQRTAQAAAALTFALGVAVLCGWACDVAVLKSILPGWPGMKPSTGACFALFGTGLALSLVRPGRRGVEAAATVFSCLTLAVGGATTLGHLLGFDLGLDQVLFRDVPGRSDSRAPGRMSLSAAVAFVCLGGSLLGLRCTALPGRLPGRNRILPAELLALAAALPALVVVLGKLQGARFDPSGGGSDMALPTAFGLLIGAAGILTARPDCGGVAWLAADKPGSLVARRLLLALAVLTPIQVVLVSTLVRTALLDARTGQAVGDVMFLGLLAAVVLWTGRGLNRLAEAHSRAETSLRHEEARFRRLAESGLVGMVFADAQANVLDANDKYLEITGYSREDIAAGRVNWRSLTPTGHQDSNDIALSSMVTTGIATLFAKEYLRKDGTRIRVLIGGAVLDRVTGSTVALILDDTERHAALEALQRVLTGLEHRVAVRTEELTTANEALQQDIAERLRIERALRASEQRYRSLTESANDALVSADQEGCVRFWNSAASRVFGWAPEDILGEPLTRLMPPHYHDAHRAGMERFCQTGEARGRLVELEGLRKGGEVFPLEMSLSTWNDGDQLAFTAILRDITDRRRAEVELRNAWRAAEAASRVTLEFLANTSHEIRTPMNAIVGMAELLWTTDLEPDQRRLVQSFRDGGKHLLGIINDILDFSKFEMGPMQLAAIPFDPGDLAEEAIELLAPRAHAKNLDLGCVLEGDLPLAVGDPQRLRQVLVNLVSNAVKFTDVGSVVLRVERPAAGKLRFTVQDTGVGIEPALQSQIFESFTQVDASTTRRHGGTGLGLSISQRLVECMGGRIEVRSQPNAGAVFTFTLALPEAAAGVGPDPEAAGPVTPRNQVRLPAQGRSYHPARLRLDGYQVLVVEPRTLQREILGSLLTTRGAKVHLAGSVAEVLAWVEPSAPVSRAQTDLANVDVALVARQLPDGDGLTLLAQLRAGGHAEAGVLLRADDDGKDDPVGLRSAGVMAVLHKPVRREALALALAEVLGLELESPAVEAEAPLRVLVVDDAADNRLLARAFLRPLGCAIDEATTGAAAVAQCLPGRFDVVLMDVQMPVMDGYDATRAIRAQEKAAGAPPVPIVALTAYGLEESRRQSREAGCSLHLAKPVRQAELLDAIQALTGRGRLPGPPVARSVPLVVRVPALLGPLIPAFMAQRSQDVAEAQNAMKTNDFATVALVGHRLRGSAGSYGFTGLSDIGQGLEDAAGAADDRAVAAAVANLKAYLDRVVVEVDAAPHG